MSEVRRCTISSRASALSTENRSSCTPAKQPNSIPRSEETGEVATRSPNEKEDEAARSANMRTLTMLSTGQRLVTRPEAVRVVISPSDSTVTTRGRLRRVAPRSQAPTL